MSNNSLATTFVIQQSHLASMLNKKVDNQLSIHGISFTEYTIMYHLYNSPLKTMRRIELAEQVGISASGVTRLVAPMEKIKILEKEINPRDARQSLVKLSKVGQQLYKDATISFEHCCENLVSQLTQSQLKKLIGLVDRMHY